MYVHFQISREIFLNFSNFKCNLRIPIINMGIKKTLMKIFEFQWNWQIHEFQMKIENFNVFKFLAVYYRHVFQF